MNVDDKEFFREFTLRICSSLELEKALWNCFNYVSKIMPTDELSLIVFDPETGIVENVARADKEGGVSLAVKTAVPPEITAKNKGHCRKPQGQNSGRYLSGRIRLANCQRSGGPHGIDHDDPS